ncbi:hypothetical protein [Spirosoma oryzicola]|uniref:hypothetical protein n=1 Tax=Spirosoma oryzicola TaxID=2898794 RepID=UPI001E3AA45E|nr:hypothetical protein [Spirosoma oryzicola]UHG93393.1 hypothetical protein LQ777_10920 [Spirosoma oryzicola]
MKQSIHLYVLAGLLMGLLALVVARPWGQLNNAVGIESVADSIRADTLSRAELDSLIIDTEAVTMTLPNAISDSLSYSFEARKKKKAYLEEQNALLQKQNQQLETKLNKKRQSLMQNLVSLQEVEQLLVKQSGSASKIVVSPENP